MPTYYYGGPEVRVKTSRPSRTYEFVRSKSFSYGHRDHHDRHHHHHHRHLHHVCPENCAGVTYDEWESVLQKSQKMYDRKEHLAREAQALKGELQGARDEVCRLTASNQQLTDENEQLRCKLAQECEAGADKFRRRVASMKVEIEQKDTKIFYLEKDNSSLLTRVRDLTRCAQDEAAADKIAADVAYWKKRANDTLDLVKRFETGYDRVLKDLDKQHVLLDQYKDRIRHLEGHAPRNTSVRFVHERV